MASSGESHKLMAEKLFIEVQHGRIENEWEENFISDVYRKTLAGHSLTEKQAVKLEALFERY